MTRLNFGPARDGEPTVFGAERPDPKEFCLDSWATFMLRNGIGGVVCLLSDVELRECQFYGGLLLAYDRESPDRCLHEPIDDGDLPTLEGLPKILHFVEELEADHRRVVVHCRAGRGRTAVVLAAWLRYARGLDPEKAIRSVQEASGTSRDPFECGRPEVVRALLAAVEPRPGAGGPDPSRYPLEFRPPLHPGGPFPMPRSVDSVRAPWWWSLVEADLTPGIAALAAESHCAETLIAQRVWAVLKAMVREGFPIGSLRELFPEIVMTRTRPSRAAHGAFQKVVSDGREGALARSALERLALAAREGTLPPLPGSQTSLEGTPRDWRIVFRRSRRRPDAAFLRGTGRSHTGSDSPDHEAFDDVFRICRRYGVVRTFYSTGGMANASTHEDYAAFLDGGLVSKAGDYVGESHGAWIIGRAALRFACFELGLTQPRWPKAAGPAPSHADLARQMLIQLATELPGLHERLRELQGW